MNISEIINKLSKRENLSDQEVREVMNEIMKGNATPSQIGGFLIGLKVKGETVDEIYGAVEALKDNAIRVYNSKDYLIDVCGTGGDGGKTFNISTATSIVVASSGVKVAKHGNRAISSKCGSFDVLNELSIPTNFNEEKAREAIEKIGMAFLFAPNFHKAMKNVAGVRGELGTRTIFNLIGPLVNPAKLSGQLMGIYDGKLLKTVGEVLLKSNIERGLVVHGMDGLDEISLSDGTNICEINNGTLKEYTIYPEDFNIERKPISTVSGGDGKVNSRIILDILLGEKGPCRDVVLLNSAAALYVGKKVSTLLEGKLLAEELIDSKTAYKKYEELKGFK